MEKIISFIEKYSQEFWDYAVRVHGFAEMAGEEYRSAGLLGDVLEEWGFAVERGLGSQPTAFRAVYGSGNPMIGFLAEYDALPNLNQGEGSVYSGDGSSGHGCGHNLLGMGSVTAALAVKHMSDEGDFTGTIVVYGCPAEETLYGKSKMAQEGYFKDLDVVFAWHPEDHYCCGEISHKAMDSIQFSFHGISAHASVCPELGRSALDAAELMSVGVNYLREHVPDGVRIHYSYVNAGEKPNVVPDFAKVWYFVRGERRGVVDDVTTRVIDVARGAALMTGTRAEWDYLASGQETLINTVLSQLSYRCMEAVPRPVWGNEELSAAEKLKADSGVPSINGSIDTVLHKPDGVWKAGTGSTDFSAVSQLVPSVEINTVCMAQGTPGHHWTVTAQSCSAIGKKGMIYAAKVLAAMAVEMSAHKEILMQAKEEFSERKKMSEYK